MSFKSEKDRLLATFFTKSPALVDVWARSAPILENTTVPWAEPAGNPFEGPIALVTTAGVHLRTQEPFDMKHPEGDCTFRDIPSSSSPDALLITHNYYDHRDADEDINVVFPIERLNDLCEEGLVRQVAPRHFSFMGHIRGRQLARLIEETAPAVASELKKDGVRAAYLTPA
jgi:D-proline reductase (dithiol) PrdB